jgi:hypothetical protein
MNEISKNTKEAYRCAQEIRRACPDAHVVWLADAFRDTLARQLMAQNDLAYVRIYEEYGREFEQWQAEAHKTLMGGET